MILQVLIMAVGLSVSNQCRVTVDDSHATEKAKSTR